MREESWKKLLSDAKQLQIKVECTIFEGVQAANSQKWRTIITEDIGVDIKVACHNFKVVVKL